MIPDNHAKSFLSQSYVHAVATQAGYTCKFNECDYGIDATISEVQFLPSGKYVDTGYHFNVQIKASHDFVKHDYCISYELKADAYNRLIYHVGGLIVLVVFCLPQEPTDRLVQSEDSLELRNCCYWYRVTGALTDHSSKNTLQIPRVQLFTPDTCTTLMQWVKVGD